jgi:hypothetical protein
MGPDGISLDVEHVWRTLAAISTECDLESGEYRVAGNRVRVSAARYAITVSQPGDKRAIEILLDIDTFPDVKAAHAYAEGILAEFLDRVALSGYASTRLERLVSTCPLSVLPGEEFEMVIPDMDYQRTRVRVSPSDISRFDTVLTTDSVQFARNRIRKALESPSLEDRLLNDYIALERVADDETADTVKQTCSNCNETVDTGRKATAKYIRQLLVEDGVDAKVAREVTTLRGRLAHGAGLRTESFLRDVCRLVAVVEGTAVGVTAERSGALVRHPDQLIPALPVTRYSCKRHFDGGFSILGFERKTTTSVASVKRAKAPAPGAQVLLGISTDETGALPIDPDAWPD